jgi:hypothetical protein
LTKTAWILWLDHKLLEKRTQFYFQLTHQKYQNAFQPTKHFSDKWKLIKAKGTQGGFVDKE